MARIHKIYADKNPFVTPRIAFSATIMTLDDYQLGIILKRLSPSALRLLFYILRHVKNDGSVDLIGSNIGRDIITVKQHVNKAVHELVLHDFITRHTFYNYWVNPRFAQQLIVHSQ